MYLLFAWHKENHRWSNHLVTIILLIVKNTLQIEDTKWK